MIVDKHGREVSYLRLSVTDRCNLRCLYCRAHTEMKLLRHDDILSYEEMLELIGVAVSLGVYKVRLTGGEPLVRRDFLSFLELAASRWPQVELLMTTNATMLSGKAARLKAIGIQRLNISLDTLDREKFARITGADFFPRVRAAIDECLAVGLGVKINAVAMRGVNDDELPTFMDFALKNPIDLRFIEFMPMGDKRIWNPERQWAAEDILAEARRITPVVEMPQTRQPGGPARIFELPHGAGRFGLISPLTNHFCGTCNRLRITADGRLRPCLFSEKEYRLRPLLRHAKLGAAAVRRVIEMVGRNKPVGNDLLAARMAARGVDCGRSMSAIGG